MPLTSSAGLLLVKSKHNQKRREYSKITKHVEKIIPEGIWKPSAWDSPCAHPTDVNSERWMLWWQILVLLASKETTQPAGQRAGFARSKLALRLAKTLSAGKSQSWVLAARGKGKKKETGKDQAGQAWTCSVCPSYVTIISSFLRAKGSSKTQ